jgi:hypothetical protein
LSLSSFCKKKREIKTGSSTIYICNDLNFTLFNLTKKLHFSTTFHTFAS